MRRERRSAKGVVTDYANELLKRTNDPHLDHKIATVEVIAMRMGWNDLYNRLRFRSSAHSVETAEEKWWQK